jgi:predicted DCC family thiol-disulfide oxidoreductase YuxK
MNSATAIVFFDIECLLCNRWIRFVLKRSRNLLAFPQPFVSGTLLPEGPGMYEFSNTILVIDKGRLYEKSDAILHILKRLNGLWKVLYLLVIIPKAIRDRIYTIVAGNRYRWFGKKSRCLLPGQGNRYGIHAIPPLPSNVALNQFCDNTP